MGDENLPAPELTGEQLEAPAAEPASRQPKDPEKAKRAAEKAALTRLVKKLGKLENTEQLFEKLLELREGQAGRKTADAGEPRKTGELELAAEKKPESMPGWPSDAQIAEAFPEVLTMVCELNHGLKGTRFELPEQQKVPVSDVQLVDGKPQVVGQKEVIVDKRVGVAMMMAPAWAKVRFAIAGGNPYGVAAFGAATWVGPPLVGMGFELALPRLAAWWDRLTAPPAADDQVQAPPQLEEKK